jgi:hypothetical protein
MTKTPNLEVSLTTPVLCLCKANKVKLIAYLVHQSEACPSGQVGNLATNNS